MDKKLSELITKLDAIIMEYQRETEESIDKIYSQPTYSVRSEYPLHFGEIKGLELAIKLIKEISDNN